MDWLIVVPSGTEPEALRAKLRALGCEGPHCDAIPLGEAEEAYEVSGPRDLPARAAGDALVRGVSPNSDMTLY